MVDKRGFFSGDPYGTPRLRAGQVAALRRPRRLIHSRSLRVPRGTGTIKKERPRLSAEPFFFGDPYGTRTHVTAVKGRCLNHLTNGPDLARPCGRANGGGTWIRTGDTSGMNRMLWPTELCRHELPKQHRNYNSSRLSCQPFFSLFRRGCYPGRRSAGSMLRPSVSSAKCR